MFSFTEYILLRVNMKQRITISEADLRQRYVDNGQTLMTIAAAIGCSAATVSNMLRRYGIATRDARFQAHDISRDLLFQLYMIERLPIKIIAERFGVHVGTINNRRRAYGIMPRPRIT
ncbi:MAG: hypothetical protein HGA65_19275, partial [Oscillochloris sp.]|nr:hypothetical protein [Oscillochloris sp.]